METRVCNTCGVSKPISEFRLSSAGTGNKKRRRLHICTECLYKKNKLWRESSGYSLSYNANKKEYRRKQKEEAVKYKGGICNICGNSFHIAAFDFHHIDPKEKDIDPGLLMQRSPEILYKELDKCILLCANCHRILHYNEGFK